MSGFYIGIDLGGTKVATVLTDREGKILASDRRPTEAAAGAERVLDNICGSVRAVMGDTSANQIVGIGVACAGAVDIKKGIIVDTPNLGWKNFAINQALEERLHLPCALENDANAAALGEWLFGAGKNTSDLIYITVSTGVGGGIICNRQIVHGRDYAAGEVGHIVVDVDGPLCNCGRRGCLEAISSGTAITAQARKLVASGRPSLILAKAQNDPAQINPYTIGLAAAEGDALAKEVLDRAFYYLGVGVGNLIQIFNPEKIIIGGGVSKLGAVMFEGVWQVVRANTFAHTIKGLEIVPPVLGDECGTIGAAAVAVECFANHP